MNERFTQGMARATDLTRAGNLQEATALIRSLLGRSSDQVRAAATATRTTGTAPSTGTVAGAVIEGDFTRLDEAPEASAGRKAAPEATATSRKPATDRKPAARKMPGSRGALSAVLRRIAAGGMPGIAPGSHGAASAPPVAVPDGAQFLSLSYSAAQGRRDYRLYVPANATDTPMPLVVMLHGCTQSPEDFATGTGMNALAEEFGCLIAYPAQPSGANVQKCWNWFRPEDQGRGRGEPAILAGITQAILAEHNADPARVYVAGLSAGGAAAAIMGSAYPELFAAIGVHSGLPVGSAGDVPSAFAAMRNGAPGKPQAAFVPTIVFHGLSDSTVHPGNGDGVLTRALEGQGGLVKATERGKAPGGRSYRQTRHAQGCGRSMAEHWEIDGAGHAWSGGHAGGSYTDPQGPDASREMMRFFLQHAQQ